MSHAKVTARSDAELIRHLCRFRLTALISDAIGYIVPGTALFNPAALDDPWTVISLTHKS
jgi:hypothetical protein